MRRRTIMLPMLASVVWALAGCGSDETAPVDIGPTGPPSIRFADPPSAQGSQCVSIGDDPTSPVPLLVEVDELVLRPPGTCAGYRQCGHLALYVGDVLNNESASVVVELLLHKLADGYHDGSPHAGTGEPDVLRLSVEVVDSGLTPLNDHDGEPLADTLQLITVPSCEAAR